jgi:hypothetical protein
LRADCKMHVPDTGIEGDRRGGKDEEREQHEYLLRFVRGS